MNRLTNNLDFSLTRKRFQMMSKGFSNLNRYTRLFLLAPIVGMLAFAFCTKLGTHDSPSFDSEFYALTPKMDVQYFDIELKYTVTTDGPLKRYRYFSLSDMPYTGIQQTFFKETDQLYSEAAYQDGLLIEKKIFGLDGELRKSHLYEYKEANLLSSKEYRNGKIYYERILHSDYLESFRLYQENGIVQYEGTIDRKEAVEKRYVGLISWYDENGDVNQRHLYDDGKLIEKIK